MRSSLPARASKLQLAIEQPSTGRFWNTPIKDTACPKAKKKPQWDGRRGTVMIKSEPYVSLPILGIGQWDWESLSLGSLLILKANGIWLQDFQETGRNRDSSLGGHKQNLAHAKTQSKRAVTPQETEPKLTSSVGEPPLEVWIIRGSQQGYW